jgi:hypothetical protein
MFKVIQGAELVAERVVEAELDLMWEAIPKADRVVIKQKEAD